MDGSRYGVMGAVLLLTMGNVDGKGSAESILKGLEKAASRELENEKIEEGTNSSEMEGSREGERYVSRTFACRKTDLVRQITIEYPAIETGYACRVLYNSEKGLRTPWYARKDRDYCEPHGKSLVSKHLEVGWKCTEQ